MISERTLEAAACAALEWLEEYAEEQSGYGYARPDDPRDFQPDEECCTPAELEAHATALGAWRYHNGPPPGWVDPPRSGWEREGETVMHVLRAPWGIGTYTYRDPDVAEICDALRAALASRTPEPEAAHE